ncbi:hypothetical protein C5167_014804 [Papaver somniferum]|uniref:Uncharacterized protein n=1 Tax=Papaver somniferum TaxID=3469 RepID=A0A4Y7J572_PAPSO|nr:hypothetical protein C5167_014804 [Papaver somniferum]
MSNRSGYQTRLVTGRRLKFALGKRRKPDAPSKQAPPSTFKEDVFQQPLSPVHSDPNSFSITESISRKLDTPQMSRSEGEPPYSYHTIDPQGGASFPALPRERNDDPECEDRPEHQQSDCGFLPETEKEVSVGINGLLSQDEETVDDSDYKDSQSKHQFHAGLPLPIQSGRKGNEETQELERIEGGKRGKRNDTAYMVMLESYVLQLLCVQKVLKKEHLNTSHKKEMELFHYYLSQFGKSMELLKYLCRSSGDGVTVTDASSKIQ